MILPGLSGALILIILGAYEFILAALVNWDLSFIFVFCLGCLTGLAIFSRLLLFLLRSLRESTYALINGLLVGSLPMLWPWKQQGRGEEVGLAGESMYQNLILLPSNYTEATGNTMMFIESLSAFFLSIALVVYLKIFLFDKSA
jgi:putative membrane protein